MTSYNMDTTCWPYGLHMVVQGRVHSSQYGPSVSFLCYSIQELFYCLTLKTLVHNKDDLNFFPISILLFASILTSLKPSPILLLNNRISTLEKNTNYASINSHNFYLIFTYKQLVAFTKVSIIVTFFIYITTILDLNTLYLDI